MDGEEQLLRGFEEVWWVSVVQAMQVVVMATQVVTQKRMVKVWDLVNETPSVVDDVEQEVPVVVEVRGQEDHVEILQHVVGDHEIAAVEQWVDEDQVLAKNPSEVVAQTLSEQPFQNLWATEARSSMSSEAKSSEKVARRAGET